MRARCCVLAYIMYMYTYYCRRPADIRWRRRRTCRRRSKPEDSTNITRNSASSRPRRAVQARVTPPRRQSARVARRTDARAAIIRRTRRRPRDVCPVARRLTVTTRTAFKKKRDDLWGGGRRKNWENSKLTPSWWYYNVRVDRPPVICMCVGAVLYKTLKR